MSVSRSHSSRTAASMLRLTHPIFPRRVRRSLRNMTSQRSLRRNSTTPKADAAMPRRPTFTAPTRTGEQYQSAASASTSGHCPGGTGLQFLSVNRRAWRSRSAPIGARRPSGVSIHSAGGALTQRRAGVASRCGGWAGSTGLLAAARSGRAKGPGAACAGARPRTCSRASLNSVGEECRGRGEFHQVTRHSSDRCSGSWTSPGPGAYENGSSELRAFCLRTSLRVLCRGGADWAVAGPDGPAMCNAGTRAPARSGAAAWSTG